jgi:mRNA interferase HigB
LYLWHESSFDKERNNRRILQAKCSKPNFICEWLTKIKFADWEEPADMQRTFPSTDLFGNSSNRAVFDIGGNNYRMICKYAFGDRQIHLFICWIGTHAEYDKLCDNNKQYTVSVF